MRPDGRFTHAAYLFFFVVVVIIVVVVIFFYFVVIVGVIDVEIGQPQLALWRSQAAHD